MNRNKSVSVHIVQSTGLEFVAHSSDVRTAMKRRAFVAQWFAKPVIKKSKICERRERHSLAHVVVLHSLSLSFFTGASVQNANRNVEVKQ
jgi:hypothetical protein